MSEREDAKLVRECLAGNTAAFGALVDEYQKPLFNAALRITGDYEEARDITQTVFVKAYEKLDSYRSEHRLFSWLYRMLVNESINSVKRRQRFEHVATDIKATAKTPAEEYESGRLSTVMQEALAELSFDYRLVIVLRYFNDMGYKEMSDILAVPEKTVKSRLYTARQNLAMILAQKGITSYG